ncbi:hypothetical protein A1O7_03205 [Cladophialophora yegresii CBS 114405]|uniref:Uncharacterized protein n=1 Tax=Cladophialophora yegresii CBS 114405 TaxID=1182544 RepID=W9WDY3_9EURO|nr:uncharacterized protein A1O7_03205 [Cladophialophora yegresii CBS 114405]EXJ62766.1 hypothetical protein A1O7_03205 [Cladophialophora yegresii CBS 114405]
MAAAVGPIELPTGRRSYYNTSTPVDIHDPNWIPVLHGTAYKPQLSPAEKEVFQPQPPASFSLFPLQPNSPKPRPGFSHAYSKSSMAPESVASDSDSRSQSALENIEPLPSIPSHVQYPRDASRGHNRQITSTTAGSNEEKISGGTDTHRDMGSTPSIEDNENASSTKPAYGTDVHSFVYDLRETEHNAPTNVQIQPEADGTSHPYYSREAISST